jgi:hypothetical protein
LHLFTGTHEDYHKPSDDAEKVNYKGMSTLTSFVYSITDRYELDRRISNHMFVSRWAFTKIDA